MKRVIFITVAFLVVKLSGHAQTNTFPATGNVGIGTLSPAAKLQVIGSSRFGSVDNYGTFDSSGNLSFKGTAAYKVAGNKYAFQYSGDPDYGLFFNSTNVRYEFRNGTAVPIFYIDANNGNSVFNGTLKVGAYTLPVTDGANGQVLKTNSSGSLAWSNDNNTNYSAGNGISLGSNTITNTSPDQTVTLTGNGGSSVTGTYPNFIITSAVPTIYTAGTGINLTGNAINSVWTQSGNNIFNNNTANIGMGISTPQQKLDVNGNINIAKGYSLYIGNERTFSMETGTEFIITGNLYVGTFAGMSNTTGIRNTVSGYKALYSNTTASDNTATGFQALYFNNGSNNSASGSYALYKNTSGIENTASGSYALYNNTAGNANVASGYQSLYSNTTASNNSAIGHQALYSNNGFYNTATGYQALYSNTIANYNTANGFRALYSNTTGSQNTASGYRSLFFNTTGSYNSAGGYQALYSNTTADSNTAVGYRALYLNTTGSRNTAAGSFALHSNTTASNNTAYGNATLYSNTTGSKNTANGMEALYSNITGSNNTASGFQALKYNINGYENVACGNYALYNNTDGMHNTAVGYEALKNNNGYSNTAIGFQVLALNSSGVHNTALGAYALKNNTTGNFNLAFGGSALYNNTSGGLNTAIGYNADMATPNLSNTTAIGYGALVAFDNQVRIGNTNISSIGGYANWSNVSDGRYKKNVKNNVPGLVFINELKPVTYTLDITGVDTWLHKDMLKTDKGGNALYNLSDVEKTARVEKEKIVYTGFVAQEVEAAAKKLNFDFSGVDKPQTKDGLYGLRYAEFVVPLVKAVQELSKQVDDLKSQLNEITKNQIKNLNQSTTDGTLKISAEQPVISLLGQNIPNPFDRSTIIPFRIPKGCKDAAIVIAQTGTGKIVRAIPVSCGETQLTLEAGSLSPGTYMYTLHVDGKLIDTKQMILAK